MKKEVSHQNIIKGLLKEALFLDLEVQIHIADTFIHGRIVELNDNDDQAMMIYLEMGAIAENDFPEKIELSIFFKNFMARFETEVSFLRMPFLMIKLPKMIYLTNERGENRHHLADDSSEWTRVLIANQTASVPARFRPTNISNSGMGGELIYPSDFDLSPYSEITGEQWFNGQWIKIKGRVRSVRQMTEQHDQHTFCIVGLQNEEKTEQPNREFVKRPLRLQSDTELEVSFVAQPSKRFNIKILNVSVGGFLAKIHDKEIQKIAIASKIASRSQSSMKAQLVSYNDDQFGFQWISGNEEDRLIWLKHISQFFGPEIDAQSLKKDDILSLFCQSGALSNQYIKEQRSLSKDLLDALSKNSSDEPWIFRWTNRTADGKAKGYVGAIKSGENCWSIIDIVSDRYEHKLSREFLPNFFVTFMEFSKTITPCPKHFLGWVKDHPFFAGFEKHLHEHQDLILSECEMLYTRLKKETLQLKQRAFEAERIQSGDFALIRDIRAELQDFGMLDFADGMDLNENLFASTHLTDMFKDKNLPFKREYWTLKKKEANYLVIFTLLPEGQNPGRWVDSIFVFDLSKSAVSTQDWNEFKDEVVTLALERGYSTHAIRRMAKKGQHEKYEGEVAHLSAYMLHPLAWAFFQELTSKK